MTESASARIDGHSAGGNLEKVRGRSSSPTRNFGELKEKFCRVVATIDGMSSGYQENAQHVDELHYQEVLDTLTDQLQVICVNLATLRATCADHLKLKISALLYLLPDDADTELRLMKSLLADLEDSALALPPPTS